MKRTFFPLLIIFFALTLLSNCRTKESPKLKPGWKTYSFQGDCSKANSNLQIKKITLAYPADYKAQDCRSESYPLGYVHLVHKDREVGIGSFYYYNSFLESIQDRQLAGMLDKMALQIRREYPVGSTIEIVKKYAPYKLDGFEAKGADYLIEVKKKGDVDYPLGFHALRIMSHRDPDDSDTGFGLMLSILSYSKTRPTIASSVDTSEIREILQSIRFKSPPGDPVN